MDFSGKIISKYSVEMSYTNISVLLQICELVFKAEVTVDDIDEIGISIPGHIENKTGKTILAENLKGSENISVPKFFSEKYGRNVIIDDCSRLMGLAELRLGTGKGC